MAIQRTPGIARSSRVPADVVPTPGPFPSTTPVFEVSDEHRKIDAGLTENYEGYEA